LHARFLSSEKVRSGVPFQKTLKKEERASLKRIPLSSTEKRTTKEERSPWGKKRHPPFEKWSRQERGGEIPAERLPLKKKTVRVEEKDWGRIYS